MENLTTQDVDTEGYLRDLSTWTPELAQKIASDEGIVLSPAHWEILQYLRELYTEFGIIPPMRILVKNIAQKLGSDKGNSMYLMRLFSGTPIRIASKIAGLPKPTNCL